MNTEAKKVTSSPYDKEIEEFKKDVLRFAKETMERDGNLHAIMFILSVNKGKTEQAVIPVGEFMQNDNTKDVLAELVPATIARMREVGIIPLAFMFISEAWVRKAHKDEYDKTKDYKTLPVTGECILATFESETSSQMWMNNVERKEDGTVVVTESSDGSPAHLTSGRFTRLFRGTGSRPSGWEN